MRTEGLRADVDGLTLSWRGSRLTLREDRPQGAFLVLGAALAVPAALFGLSAVAGVELPDVAGGLVPFAPLLPVAALVVLASGLRAPCELTASREGLFLRIAGGGGMTRLLTGIAGSRQLSWSEVTGLSVRVEERSDGWVGLAVAAGDRGYVLRLPLALREDVARFVEQAEAFRDAQATAGQAAEVPDDLDRLRRGAAHRQDIG